MISIEGVIVPLLTPINADETVCWADLDRLVDYVIDGGVDGIFAMGTSGEFCRFDAATRRDVIASVVKRADHRVPIYAGVSDCGTKLVKDHIRDAESAGADVIVSSLPYYIPNKSSREDIQFFSDIAASTSLPVVLYNIPSTVGSVIPLDVVRELSKTENIAGIKDSGADEAYMRELLNIRNNEPNGFSVLVGDESMAYTGLTMGVDGLVPSIANPFPRLTAMIMRCAVDSDMQNLKFYTDILSEMNQLNHLCDGWMAPNIWRKAALKQMGVCGDGFTKPYIAVDAETSLKIAKTVEIYRKLFNR